MLLRMRRAWPRGVIVVCRRWIVVTRRFSLSIRIRYRRRLVLVALVSAFGRRLRWAVMMAICRLRKLSKFRNLRRNCTWDVASLLTLASGRLLVNDLRRLVVTLLRVGIVLVVLLMVPCAIIMRVSRVIGRC